MESMDSKLMLKKVSSKILRDVLDHDLKHRMWNNKTKLEILDNILKFLIFDVHTTFLQSFRPSSEQMCVYSISCHARGLSPCCTPKRQDKNHYYQMM